MNEPTEEQLYAEWREEQIAEQKVSDRMEADELSREYENFNWEL